MRQDWEESGVVVVVVLPAAEIGIVEVGSFAGTETGIVVAAASEGDSFSGRNKVLGLALRLRRSTDVGSASQGKRGEGGKG